MSEGFPQRGRLPASVENRLRFRLMASYTRRPRLAPLRWMEIPERKSGATAHLPHRVVAVEAVADAAVVVVVPLLTAQRLPRQARLKDGDREARHVAPARSRLHPAQQAQLLRHRERAAAEAVELLHHVVLRIGRVMQVVLRE